MTWSLGEFTERADPYRDVNVWNCAVLRNGKFVGSINFAVDRQTVVYQGLNDLPTSELGRRVVAALGHHVGGLIATGKFPRTDDFLLEVRITEEESQQVLQSAAPVERDYSLVVPTLDSSTDSTMAIRSLSFEGLFGFGVKQKIELNNELTVAIGENGSGKSSIRKALSALRNLAGSNELFVQRDTWKHVPTDDSIPTKISVDLTDGHADSVTYQIDLSEDTSAKAFVSEEILTVGEKLLLWKQQASRRCEFVQTLDGGPGTARFAVIHSPVVLGGGLLPTLASESLHPEAARTLRTLEGIRCFSAWDFVASDGIVRDKASHTFLDHDGANLAPVLRGLSESGQAEKFDERFSEVMDGEPKLTVEAGALRYRHDGRNLPVAGLSDGSLRWAQIVAATFGAASLLVFDEPELGLHPDLIGSLADLLVATGKSKQVLVFTHSKDLLDRLDDGAKVGSLSIVALEQEAAGNTVYVPDVDALRRSISEESEGHSTPLSELWTSGLLGGNRW